MLGECVRAIKCGARISRKREGMCELSELSVMYYNMTYFIFTTQHHHASESTMSNLSNSLGLPQNREGTMYRLLGSAIGSLKTLS